MNVTGKSVSELLDMNPDKLSAADLRQVVSRIASAGNKRLKRLEESGMYSPAADDVIENGGKFSVKNKSRDDLLTEFKREREFFDKKTSSVRGIRDIRNRTAKTLESRGVTNINKEQIGEAFAVYDRLKKYDPCVAVKNLKYATVNAVMELNADLDIDDKFLAMIEQLDAIYEEQEELYIDFDGASKFFEI